LTCVLVDSKVQHLCGSPVLGERI